MQLTEKHIINLNYSLFKECDKLCFNSKNIYNRSIFLIKQYYINNKSYNTLNNLYNILKKMKTVINYYHQKWHNKR